jgi:hypothetical protein
MKTWEILLLTIVIVVAFYAMSRMQMKAWLAEIEKFLQTDYLKIKNDDKKNEEE